jgi:hypothetical protein
MIPVIMTEATIYAPNPYLKIAVERANIKNKTIVLGDEYNKDCGARHYHLSDYSKKADEFTLLYKHLNFNPEAIEILCYRRWFIIHEFMEANDIEVCFHCDTDVLVFVDVNDEYYRFKDFEISLNGRTSGHTGYFTRKGLKNLCDFIFEVYKERGFWFELLETRFELSKKYGVQKGVCDMTLLGIYADHNHPKVGEMLQVGDYDYPFFDHHLRCEGEHFQMANGVKDIRYSTEYGMPWCARHDGRNTPFASIHFQGTLMKPYMKEVHEGVSKT